MKSKHICEILKNENIAPGIFDMTVKFPENAQPGQFVHVLCGGDTVLRRPISICECQGGILRFVYQVRGKGTELLSKKVPGEPLDILGPLGNGFDCGYHDGINVVIGGGIGVFPLLMLARKLPGTVAGIFGFRTKELVVLEKDFSVVCQRTYIATDDGTYGHHGFVTDILKDLINSEKVGAVYACGPVPMLSAVKKITAEHGIFCQLSAEQRMGCGIGSCAVCTCKSHGENVKVCQRGPVFDAEDLDI